MIQHIIDGIISKIRTKYDKSFRIYTESVEQGLIEPCFSILCLNPSGERELGNRYKRYFPCMITYFPSSDEPIAECNAVCEELLGLLNDIDTEVGTIHTSGIPSGQVIDGNLQFSIQYDLFALLQVEDGELLEDLSIDGRVVQ